MNNTPKVYLDNAATTPLDPRVLDSMLPYFRESFGNPSSVHFFGQRAERAVDEARETVATYLKCKPGEIIFTSGGTESDNLAIRGAALASWKKNGSKHVLISPVEHHAITHTANQLQNLHGFEIELLPVDEYGMVHPDSVSRLLRPDTALVSVMYANNEIGTINPINDIGEVCQEHGIPFHTDALQAAAYLSLNVDDLRVNLMSLGSHKFYGPKGIGVLYIRDGTEVTPIQTGGSQEYGYRAGTHNVPYIVGFAKALEIVQSKREKHSMALQQKRDEIIELVIENIPGSFLTGHPSARLPNHASFVFEGVDGNTLLTALDAKGFACSSGSACKTGNPEPSAVLTSLGINQEIALGSLRISLGIHTKSDEITKFLDVLPGTVNNVRKLCI